MNAFDYFFEHTNNLEKPFLVGKEEITYKDLYSSCQKIAGWINEKVGTEKHILLLSVNNLFFLKTYLAILKSGNICIPLDPYIEKENFKYISRLTNPSLVFLTDDIGKKLPVSEYKCIYPGEISGIEESATAGISHNVFDGEKCAEIIFTSGSTGKPKGVMISHKNLIANTVINC